jgi:hypothetical protein
MGKFSDYLILQPDRIITAYDYIEWQISYDIKIDNIFNALRDGKNLDGVIGESKSKELKERISEGYASLSEKVLSKSKKECFLDLIQPILDQFEEKIIVKNRGGRKVKILINELSDYYRSAYKHNIVSRDEVLNLIDYANSINHYLDSWTIEREIELKKVSGFALGWEKYPLFTKDLGGDFFIEIIKKHMQYAIGYQNMVFLCVGAGNLRDDKGDRIIGRSVNDLKSITFSLNKDVITETLRAFVVASENHKRDIVDILSSIIKVRF